MAGDKKLVNYQDHYKKKNPNRSEHLREYWWKPGQSGNPDGRPTGSISLVEQLKAHLRRHPEDIKDIILALIKEGKVGNLVATKEMLDRIDGKVAETHRIEGELPVKLIFMPAQILIDSEKAGQIIEGEAKELSGACTEE